MKLDGKTLLEAIEEEIGRLQMEAVQNSGIGWYESAAKLHVQAEGLAKARQMIMLGDYTLED